MSAVPYPGPQGEDGFPVGWIDANAYVRCGKYILRVYQLEDYRLAYYCRSTLDGSYKWIPTLDYEAAAERRIKDTIELEKRRVYRDEQR